MSRNFKMTTYSRVRELFSYEKDTGNFVRRLNISNTKKGSVAGTVSKSGYISIGADGKIYKAHRLAWLYVYKRWPKSEIDHINHVRDDNSLLNLREANRTDNNKNRSIFSKSLSRLHGVTWHKNQNRWQAGITINKKQQHLGVFKDKFEAICARKSAECSYGFHKNHGAEK